MTKQKARYWISQANWWIKHIIWCKKNLTKYTTLKRDLRHTRRLLKWAREELN